VAAATISQGPNHMTSLITRAERRALVEMPSKSLEARAVRANLRAAGHDWCRCCNRVQPFGAFARRAVSASQPRGRQSRCRTCRRRRTKVVAAPDRVWTVTERAGRYPMLHARWSLRDAKLPVEALSPSVVRAMQLREPVTRRPTRDRLATT
jgi:hypothetical protein